MYSAAEFLFNGWGKKHIKTESIPKTETNTLAGLRKAEVPFWYVFQVLMGLEGVAIPPKLHNLPTQTVVEHGCLSLDLYPLHQAQTDTRSLSFLYDSCSNIPCKKVLNFLASRLL